MEISTDNLYLLLGSLLSGLEQIKIWKWQWQKIYKQTCEQNIRYQNSSWDEWVSEIKSEFSSLAILLYMKKTESIKNLKPIKIPGAPPTLS